MERDDASLSSCDEGKIEEVHQPSTPDVTPQPVSESGKIKAMKPLKLECKELKVVELGKNVMFRILRTAEGDQVYDIRHYYRGLPTKRGVRLKPNSFNCLRTIELI